jgi:hypothetical protein
MTDHQCEFPEVLVEETDEDDLLKAGMKVLVPCRDCGQTPLEEFDFLHRHTQELQAALLATEPVRALYHWAPASRRKQIIRYGLIPGRRITTSTGSVTVSGGSPCVCFADSPSWAWALSGGMRWTPGGEWDLWMTWQDKLTEPVVLAAPDRPSGLYEVRTAHRVFKRDVWYVGSRVKP